VTGQHEELLREWVRTVDPTAEFSLEPPRDRPSGHGVSVYLIEITPSPPPRGANRPPLQLWLRYLVTTWADGPVAAQQLLLDLAFGALAQPDLEVAAESVSAETWSALGVVPQPSFVLRAAVRRDRPTAATPRVLLPLRVEPGRFVSVAGVVLDPLNDPLTGADVEAIGLDRATRTDRRGRFHLSGLPGAPVTSRLRIRAKGIEIIVGVPSDPDLARSMVVHLDPLEGEHGRTAHA
jgi:hypothetical protein